MPHDAIDAFQFLHNGSRVNLKTQLPAGLFLQMVGFVNNQMLIVGQHRAAHGHIGQQQRVIHHQNVRRFRPLPGLAQEAGGAAVQRGTRPLAVRADPRPGRQILEMEIQMRAVARLRFVQPHRRFAQHPRLVCGQRVGVAQVRPPPQAHIVGTAFQLRRLHHAGLQNARRLQNRNDGRNIFAGELFLQVNGVGGNHHPLPLRRRVKHRRQQVRNALANAGAAFHNQLAAPVNGARHRLQHFRLLRPVLKPGERPGEYAAGRQQFGNFRLGEALPDGPLRRRAGFVHQPVGDACRIQPVHPHRAGRAAAPRMRNQPLQQVGHRRVGRARRPRDERHLGRRIRCPQLQKPVKHQRRNLRIRAGTVGMAVLQPQMLRQRRQVVLRRRGQKYRRQIPSVVTPVGQRQPMSIQKAQVKSDVMPDDGQVANEIGKLPGHLAERRRPLQLVRGNGSQLLDESGNRPARVDKSLVALQRRAAAKLHRPQFNYGVRISIQPGRLQVNADELLRENIGLRQSCLCHRRWLRRSVCLLSAQAIGTRRALPQPFQWAKVAAMQRRQKLGFVKNLVGKLRYEPPQAVRAVGVAAPGYGPAQPLGHRRGETVFRIGSAAVGHLNRIGQLKYRVQHSDFRLLRNRLIRVGIQVRTRAMMLPQHAPERMRRNDEPADRVRRPTQLLRPVKPALVAVNAKGQNMPHIGIRLHRPD